jgi:hypothetical protein
MTPLSSEPDRLILHILSFVKLWQKNRSLPSRFRRVFRLSPERYSALRRALKATPDLWAFVLSNVRYGYTFSS